ncbi:hypothetical protein ACWEBX_00060 [Streptomyces sp. NPDC005070]
MRCAYLLREAQIVHHSPLHAPLSLCENRAESDAKRKAANDECYGQIREVAATRKAVAQKSPIMPAQMKDLTRLMEQLGTERFDAEYVKAARAPRSGQGPPENGPPQPRSGWPRLRYQWYRSGTAITGATKSTYTLTASGKDKMMTVKVTAKKAGYTSGTATSTAVRVSSPSGALEARPPVRDRASSTFTAGHGDPESP